MTKLEKLRLVAAIRRAARYVDLVDKAAARALDHRGQRRTWKEVTKRSELHELEATRQMDLADLVQEESKWAHKEPTTIKDLSRCGALRRAIYEKTRKP